VTVGVPPEALVSDAMRLLTVGVTGTERPETWQAAERVRQAVARQLGNSDQLGLLDDFDGAPQGEIERSALAVALMTNVEADEDFARALVVGINSDTPIDPGAAPPSGAAGPGAFAPATGDTGDLSPTGISVRGMLGVAGGLLVIGVGFMIRVRYAPTADMCQTGLGAVARSVDDDVSFDCETAVLATRIAWFVMLAGLIMIAEGAWRLYAGRLRA
jgi:hypothetical protein